MQFTTVRVFCSGVWEHRFGGEALEQMEHLLLDQALMQQLHNYARILGEKLAGKHPSLDPRTHHRLNFSF